MANIYDTVVLLMGTPANMFGEIVVWVFTLILTMIVCLLPIIIILAIFGRGRF